MNLRMDDDDEEDDRPSPLEFIPPWKQADFICSIVAGPSPRDHDRLYYNKDYARVWEQYAHLLARNIPPPKRR